MREIKFRVWDKERGYMIKADEIDHITHYNNNCYWYDQTADINPETGEIENHRQIQTESIGVVPMQYTGLEDKNGVEIYEGDVVSAVGEWRDYADGVGGTFKEVYEVEYESCGFLPFTELLKYDKREYEIIGNIYENPELIN